jgi:hypothetical protein
VNGDRNLASSVTMAPLVEGRVVRVVEAEKQILVREPGGKEVILFAEPNTIFTVNDRPARLVDLRPGMVIRSHFDVKDKRHIARSVVVTPKRPP